MLLAHRARQEVQRTNEAVIHLWDKVRLSPTLAMGRIKLLNL